MGLTRNGTAKGEVILAVDNRQARLTSIEVVAKIGRESSIKDDIEARLGRQLSIPTFYHRNRNGSLAIATGAEPTTWPEDEITTIPGRGR